MKLGKVPENVFKRSIMKQIKKPYLPVIQGISPGEDCAILDISQEEELAVTTDSYVCSCEDSGIYAVHKSINNLVTCNAKPIGITASILLPEATKEAGLKQMMKSITSTCEMLGIQLLGGDTKITDGVNRPLITITGLGKLKKNRRMLTSGGRPGMDLVVTKWVGLEGTAILAKEEKETLQKTLPKAYIEEAASFGELLSVVPEAALAAEAGAVAMHDVSEGGIFAALWEMAQASKTGLEINLRSLPLRQETVEICECLQLNPYQLLSGGSLLIACENGQNMVQLLDRHEINAAVIGKMTEGNDRIITNDEDVRYMDLPKGDEIYKR